MRLLLLLLSAGCVVALLRAATQSVTGNVGMGQMGGTKGIRVNGQFASCFVLRLEAVPR